jgi:hypothetical protein
VFYYYEDLLGVEMTVTMETMETMETLETLEGDGGDQ